MIIILYFCITIFFGILTYLSSRKKKDFFSLSPAPVDNLLLFNKSKNMLVKKARMSNTEVLICESKNGQYKCRIENDKC